jgi:hypothetical protein
MFDTDFGALLPELFLLSATLTLLVFGVGRPFKHLERVRKRWLIAYLYCVNNQEQ